MKDSLFRILMFWSSVGRRYDKLKKDPLKCNTSVTLGVASIIMSILGIALTVGFAVLAYHCFLGMDTLAFLFALIAGIVCVIASIGCFVYLVLASIVYAIYQLKLNKKAIGKAALIISLVISILTIGLVIIALTQL